MKFTAAKFSLCLGQIRVIGSINKKTWRAEYFMEAKGMSHLWFGSCHKQEHWSFNSSAFAEFAPDLATERNSRICYKCTKWSLGWSEHPELKVFSVLAISPKRATFIHCNLVIFLNFCQHFYLDCNAELWLTKSISKPIDTSSSMLKHGLFIFLLLQIHRILIISSDIFLRDISVELLEQ